MLFALGKDITSSFSHLVCNWPEFGQTLMAAAGLAYEVAGSGKVGCFWYVVGTRLVGEEKLRPCLPLNGLFCLIFL